MEWFKFNELDSSQVGIIIKEMPPIISARREIESIKVEGRNGNLHIDNGTYESYKISIVCIITDMSNIDILKSSLKGIGKLELSTVPGREFKATVMNQIAFDKYLTLLREFPIQLEIEPISYSKIENIIIKTSDGTFEVNGTVEVNPILEIKGSGNGSITLNNTKIIITGMSTIPIVIDCNLMNATQGLNSANAKIDCDNFPHLILGTNNIEMIGVTEVKIKYKEGWL